MFSVVLLSYALFVVYGLLVYYKLEMWANAQPDGRPAEYR